MWFTVGCLLERILNYLRCKQIEAAEVIFLSVLVEEAPGAALWHALDWWEGVEVGEVGVVRHRGGARNWIWCCQGVLGGSGSLQCDSAGSVCF